MTEFEEYFAAVCDGKIVACEKMKQVSEMLLRQIMEKLPTETESADEFDQYMHGRKKIGYL